MASLNKQALLRYRIIDELISRKTYPTMQDIIDLCEEKLGKRFSTETIEKDIKAMRYDLSLGYEAPIKYNYSYKGYEYTDKDFSLKKVNLSDNEFDILENTLDILRQFKGTTFNSNYESAINKISTSIKEVKEQRLGNIISLEPQSEYIGLEAIEQYIRFIKELTPISVIYAKNNDFIGEIIHPYLLKEYHNRWYLIAYSEIFKQIQIYDIRYLYDVYELTKRKFIAKEFNEDKYFKDSIGVGIIEGLKKKIKIEFSQMVYDELTSIPLHQSQKIIEYKPDGNFIVELELYITNELINKILSFGTSAKVLEPDFLVGIIKCLILNMYQKYDVDKTGFNQKYLIK